MTAELSKEETIVFLTPHRPLGFLSRLGVSIKGMGFLFPQGQCSTTVAAMTVVCLAFLRRNSGSLGASLKGKPPPFKVPMPGIAHARAGHSLVDDFYSVSYRRALCSAWVLSVCSFGQISGCTRGFWKAFPR